MFGPTRSCFISLFLVRLADYDVCVRLTLCIVNLRAVCKPHIGCAPSVDTRQCNASLCFPLDALVHSCVVFLWAAGVGFVALLRASFTFARSFWVRV